MNKTQRCVVSSDCLHLCVGILPCLFPILFLCTAAFAQPTTITFQDPAYIADDVLYGKDGWKRFAGEAGAEKMQIISEDGNKFVRTVTNHAASTNRHVGMIADTADLKWRWRAMDRTGSIVFGPAVEGDGDWEDFRNCRAFMAANDTTVDGGWKWELGSWNYMRMRLDFVTGTWSLYRATSEDRSYEIKLRSAGISGSGGMDHVMIKGNNGSGAIDIDDIVWEKAPIEYPLALEISPAGAGTISPVDTVLIARGDSAIVIADSAFGYGFKKWTVIEGPVTLGDPMTPTVMVYMPTDGNSSTVQAEFECLPLIITEHPKTQIFAAVGRPFLISVGVRACPDAGAVNYQWYHNDLSIPGATDSVFTIENAAKADGGSYHCVVQDANRTLSSESVTVTVLEPVRFIRHPSTTIINEGGTAQFRAEADGEGTIGYRWYRFRDGEQDLELPEKNTPTLSLAGVLRADSGNVYYCIASNEASSERSDLCTLLVDDHYNPFVLSVNRPGIHDTSHVRLNISTASDLSSFPTTDPLGAWADKVYVLYRTLARPSDTLESNVITIPIERLKNAGGILDTLIKVEPLPERNDSYYYFAHSILWHDPERFLPLVQADAVFMLDTLAPPNEIGIVGRYDKEVSRNSVTLELSKLGTIAEETDSIIVEWMLGTNDFSNVPSQQRLPISADSLRLQEESYTIRREDQRFAGLTDTVYVRWYPLGANGIAGNSRETSFTVGWDAPTNTVETLEPGALSSSRVNVTWTFSTSSSFDSIQILYDTDTGTIPTAQTAFNPITVGGNVDSVLITGLNRETTYYFGIRVLREELWSSVGPLPLPSILTPAITCEERPENTIKIDSAWFEPATNKIHADWHFRMIQDLHMEYGVTYGTDAAEVLDTARGKGPEKWKTIVGEENTTLIDLRGKADDTTYTICLWLRAMDCIRSIPTDSCRTVIEVPAFTWDTIVYFPQDTVRAFGDDVVFQRGEYEGRTTGDRLFLYEPRAIPHGFVRAGIGFWFQEGLQSSPLRVGIRHGDLPEGVSDTAVRLYRVEDELLYVEHDSYIENGIAWVKTNELTRPFIVLADTAEPSLSFGDKTMIDQAVDPNEPTPYQFTVSDNSANARWRLEYSAGNKRYGFDTSGVLTGTSGTIDIMLGGRSVSESYGLRAYIHFADGVHSKTINCSRPVRSPNLAGIAVNAGVWTPLRVAGRLDNDAFTAVCDELPNDEKWAYDNTVFRAFRWVEDTASHSQGRWLEYDEEVTDSFRVVPGRVIWVKRKKGTTIECGPGTTMGLKKPLSIALAPENWTDIALPHNFKVLLSDILDSTRASGVNGPRDPDSIQVVHWVRGVGEKLYKSDPVYSPIVPQLSDPRDTIALEHDQALAAYSVYNPFDTVLTLLVPPLPAATFGGAARNVLSKRKSSPDSWSVGLESSSPEWGALNTVYCGVDPTLECPNYLPLSPTFKKAGVGVVDTLERNVGAHAMFQGLTEGGAIYKLAFYNHSTEPAQISTRVGDTYMLTEGTLARLYPADRTGGGESVTVDLAPNETEHGWLAVGNQAFIGSIGLPAFPRKAALLGTWPNPFFGRVKIHYELPAEGAREITFTAHDLRGRLVWKKLLRDGLTPGRGAVVWNSADSRGAVLAGGVYILRMAVKGRGGDEPKVFTRRLTLMR
ncbi:MAG: hypothetical protein GF344_16750 [Chitinivibrionales bacterium]|nr:hypothetical protein [Chitinivibrionales bacterium]MBD3358339.1 hypothetical protein [Chitinivibrionales bacterium]